MLPGLSRAFSQGTEPAAAAPAPAAVPATTPTAGPAPDDAEARAEARRLAALEAKAEMEKARAAAEAAPRRVQASFKLARDAETLGLAALDRQEHEAAVRKFEEAKGHYEKAAGR